MRKYKNFSNTVVVAMCLLFSLILISACGSSPNFYRVDDFQISEDSFDVTNPKSKYWRKLMHYDNTVNIEDMNNQKFLRVVKSNSYDRYDVVWNLWWNEKKYFSIRACDNYGQTALMWACWNGDSSMVGLLLALTSNKGKPDKKYINQTSNNGYTALFCSAFKGDDITMRLLLDYGAYLDSSKKDQHGENLLHKMAKSGKASNMRLILCDDKYGFKSSYRSQWERMFYEKDESGYTPFHYAIVKNDSQMVRMLLEIEREAKWSNEEPIVNIYANLGNQRVYPLNTAYWVDNPDIFKLLLEDERLDINIKFYDGNAEHDYEHIDDDFNLAKRGKYVFQEKKKNINTFESYDEENIYFVMFDKRKNWEDDGREGKPEVSSIAFERRKSEVIELIELEDDSGVKLSASERIAKLNILLKELHGVDLGTIGYYYGKDLLELAVKNKCFKTNEKIAMLNWLLKKGYRSSDPNDDILYFCLHNFNGENDFFQIAEYLIRNKGEYGDSYRFERPDRESYVEIMTNPYIRSLKNAWPRLEELLKYIKGYYDFNREEIDKNISCAVLASKEPAYGPQKKFPQYALEFFNFFRDQYSDEIRIGKYPLCSWFFIIGFDTGVDEILSDDKLAKALKLGEPNEYQFKKLLESYSKSSSLDMERQKKIAEWKEKYEKIFPTNPSKNTNRNSSKNTKAGANDKHSGKEFKNTIEEENTITEITD